MNWPQSSGFVFSDEAAASVVCVSARLGEGNTRQELASTNFFFFYQPAASHAKRWSGRVEEFGEVREHVGCHMIKSERFTFNE